MLDPTPSPDLASSYRELLRRTVVGGAPRGEIFDACRAVLHSDRPVDEVHHATCTLLEGLLADPELAIDDTNTVVQLLKALARGTILPEELL